MFWWVASTLLCPCVLPEVDWGDSYISANCQIHNFDVSVNQGPYSIFMQYTLSRALCHVLGVHVVTGLAPVRHVSVSSASAVDAVAFLVFVFILHMNVCVRLNPNWSDCAICLAPTLKLCVYVRTCMCVYMRACMCVYVRVLFPMVYFFVKFC